MEHKRAMHSNIGAIRWNKKDLRAQYWRTYQMEEWMNEAFISWLFTFNDFIRWKKRDWPINSIRERCYTQKKRESRQNKTKSTLFQQNPLLRHCRSSFQVHCRFPSARHTQWPHHIWNRNVSVNVHLYNYSLHSIHISRNMLEELSFPLLGQLNLT